MTEIRDHGGGLDAAIAQFGGSRSEWVDLSTGINPVAYPVGSISANAWTALPDTAAHARMIAAAREFWNVPEGAEIVAAPGASALIARMPALFDGQSVSIPGPTYNEHAAAFRAMGWRVIEDGKADAHVVVHPNNPDGRIWQVARHPRPVVIDESFCDIIPDQSLVAMADHPNTIILKSFGKFWGLAGLRLGFAICHPDLAARMRDMLGPWSVAGPTLEIAARALGDTAWADATRSRLAEDAVRLDTLVGAPLVGGTDLFRLYDVGDARAWQTRLAQGRVWSRVFPYSDRWLRLGLPAPDQWEQLETAL